MPTLPATRLQRMLPPTPLARRLSSQSVLVAVGEGFFLTGSAVFFTRIVGLSAAQVGLGLTIAGVVSFFFAVPLGRVAGRVGLKRMWALGALARALLHLARPWISDFVAFAAMMVVLQLVDTAGSAYTLDAFTGEERIRRTARPAVLLQVSASRGAGRCRARCVRPGSAPGSSSCPA